jgi:septum formation protein
MNEIGFQFIVAHPGIDESFPPDMPVEKVAPFLAKKKAQVYSTKLNNEIVLTADTIVILDHKILNKPLDRDDAVGMLTGLSGRTHTVITAVCLMSKSKIDCFDDRTDVTFKTLLPAEIEFYVDHFKPFDKAGAYGAQECLPAGANPCSKQEFNFLKQIGKLDLIDKSISTEKAGMVAIEEINGSYFNVMGLPLHKVYAHLTRF